MKSIYEIYIPVKDQEQFERIKSAVHKSGFNGSLNFNDSGFNPKKINNITYSASFEQFYNSRTNISVATKTESTEEEFINILKEMKNGTN